MDIDAIRTYVRVTQQIERLNDKVKILEKAKKRLAYRANLSITDLGLEKLDLAPTFESMGKEHTLFSDGKKRVVRPTTSLKPNVKKDDQPKLFEYLRETGNGDMIKPVVHYATLKSFVETMKKENKGIPTFISVYEEEGISLKLR